jgi:hypothetical protein
MLAELRAVKLTCCVRLQERTGHTSHRAQCLQREHGNGRDISAKRAAELCAETLRAVTEGEVPAYEEWRRLIRAELLFGQNFDERSLISGSESLISSAPDGLLCLWSPISELEAALTNYKENWR